MMKVTAPLFVAAIMLSQSLSAQVGCEREPRRVVYDDKPVTVYVTPGQRADVLFPEQRLKGFYPENRKSLVANPSPIRYKLSFSTTDPLYSGNVVVDGASGKTYHVNLVARADCADSEVAIENLPIQNPSHLATDKHGRPKGLMWYLWNDKTPSGYRLKEFDSYSNEDLMVMRQGSVDMYLREQVVGGKYVGTTYEVINRGRTSFRFAIENLDYSSATVRETLGVVREVSMNPIDRVLGPAPEYVSDLYSAPHRGLVFVVSEK